MSAISIAPSVLAVHSVAFTAHHQRLPITITTLLIEEEAMPRHDVRFSAGRFFPDQFAAAQVVAAQVVAAQFQPAQRNPRT
jgi:hypothetical protein